MSKIYQGSFVSIGGTVYRCEIHKRGYKGEIGELTFPDESPLTLTWEETGKEEPVQGSYATLTIESPGDRTYIDLFTLEAGDITLRVYRDGELYWSGCLDPELYEEPYERAFGYDVELTFSDFGILKRLNWDGTGYISVDHIIRASIDAACIGPDDPDYTLLCSTQLYHTPLSLDRIGINAENFYDEDGEPRTLDEVLEAILQPLALRIIQRAGRVWVYDLNSLATAPLSEQIEGAGDSQTLAADKLINKCTFTFSPYAQADIYDG
ncbi:MAG: hypothetical protein K2J06_04630, partial [Muribaculaceae bacterium]|nr:hypothetical protein [Muribaculaceae bacterium]